MSIARTLNALKEYNNFKINGWPHKFNVRAKSEHYILACDKNAMIVIRKNITKTKLQQKAEPLFWLFPYHITGEITMYNLQSHTWCKNYITDLESGDIEYLIADSADVKRIQKC